MSSLFYIKKEKECYNSTKIVKWLYKNLPFEKDQNFCVA